MRRALYYIVCTGLVLFGWRQYRLATERALAEAEGGPTQLEPVDRLTSTATATNDNYRCDGRQYCSQMKSCDEARWHQSNCTGTKMDGDHDGLPCEDWCGHH